MEESRRDLTSEEIKNLKPFEESGLYAIVDGKKVTPTNIFFGSDLHLWDEGREEETGGQAYYHFYGGLTKVYDKDGNWYRREELVCVSARYKDGVVYDFGNR